MFQLGITILISYIGLLNDSYDLVIIGILLLIKMTSETVYIASTILSIIINLIFIVQSYKEIMLYPFNREHAICLIILLIISFNV